jgi:hypothetical protein
MLIAIVSSLKNDLHDDENLLRTKDDSEADNDALLCSQSWLIFFHNYPSFIHAYAKLSSSFSPFLFFLLRLQKHFSENGTQTKKTTMANSLCNRYVFAGSRSFLIAVSIHKNQGPIPLTVSIEVFFIDPSEMGPG